MIHGWYQLRLLMLPVQVAARGRLPRGCMAAVMMRETAGDRGTVIDMGCREKGLGNVRHTLHHKLIRTVVTDLLFDVARLFIVREGDSCLVGANGVPSAPLANGPQNTVLGGLDHVETISSVYQSCIDGAG